jgi:hypothetical protein
LTTRAAGIVTTHYLEAHRLSPEGAERAEIATKARTTLLDAAARSRDLHAYAGAQRFLEQALAFAADPADEREILTRLAGAAFDAAKELADYDRAEAFARRALEAAGAGGDPPPPPGARRWQASASNNHKEARDPVAGRRPAAVERRCGHGAAGGARASDVGQPALPCPVEAALVRARRPPSSADRPAARQPIWAVTGAGARARRSRSFGGSPRSAMSTGS